MTNPLIPDEYDDDLRAAFSQGATAQIDGAPFHHNPFRTSGRGKGRQKRAAWEMGWLSGLSMAEQAVVIAERNAKKRAKEAVRKHQPVVANPLTLEQINADPTDWVVKVSRNVADSPFMSGRRKPMLTFVKDKRGGAWLTLPWTVTQAFFEDNPNRKLAEARITEFMSIQAGNDIAELLLDGDVNNKGDALLHAIDGLKKLRVDKTVKPNVVLSNVRITSAKTPRKGQSVAVKGEKATYYAIKMKIHLEIPSNEAIAA